MRRWDTRRAAKAERIAAGRAYADAKVVDPQKLNDLLHNVIRPGDRVALEGDNQKQADFLSRTLAGCDPARLHDLHMLISSVSRPEHLDLFERGIATGIRRSRCACGKRSRSRGAHRQREPRSAADAGWPAHDLRPGTCTG